MYSTRHNELPVYFRRRNQTFLQTQKITPIVDPRKYCSLFGGIYSTKLGVLATPCDVRYHQHDNNSKTKHMTSITLIPVQKSDTIEPGCTVNGLDETKFLQTS